MSLSERWLNWIGYKIGKRLKWVWWDSAERPLRGSKRPGQLGIKVGPWIVAYYKGTVAFRLVSRCTWELPHTPLSNYHERELGIGDLITRDWCKEHNDEPENQRTAPAFASRPR